MSQGMIAFMHGDFPVESSRHAALREVSTGRMKLSHGAVSTIA